ncbi:MAG: oligosaccharide flippase family protein [Firmicutes bacterium]|nr:oligosaccharide flippase family protein [Bacillota bacterium]
MKISAAKTGLFWGTILLLGSNIIVKGLGFFYRVILVRLLGVEGVGLIEMAAPIYSFLLVLAGCGIQTSLSQIIAAKHGEDGKSYLKTAVVMLLVSCITITGLAYLLAPWLINNFAPDERIILCFKMLLPAIIIICIASAFRGLFQGNKQVGSLGMSQNIEQIVRVIIGIWLISQLATAGLETKTSAASIATVCGELAGFLYLLFIYFRGRQKLFPDPHTKGKFSLHAAKELLGLGLPLTGSRLVTSGIMMLQAILIPLCLKMSGWDIRAAT